MDLVDTRHFVRRNPKFVGNTCAIDTHDIVLVGAAVTAVEPCKDPRRGTSGASEKTVLCTSEQGAFDDIKCHGSSPGGGVAVSG